jgi:membrane-associated phospholipid phosphatase
MHFKLNNAKFHKMISNPKLFLLGLVMIPISLISIFFWDQPLALFLDAQFGSSLDKAANWVSWLGLADIYFWICSLGYIFALLAEKYFNHRIGSQKSRDLKSFFSFMFLVFVTSGLLAIILKFLVGRCRPYNSPVFDPLYFKPFSFHWDFQSYPSGHTQVSFTLASFMSFYWPKLTVYFFILATVIALSRVILDYHFLGDVIFGAYIGMLGFHLALKAKKPNRLFLNK